MEIQIFNVTPEIAGSWLKKNTINRKVRPSIVSKYAKDLSSGSWSMTHQGVAFDKNGNLADGQHRLMAIVKSGISVNMVVAWGVDRSGIDRLAPRSEIDELKFSRMSEWIESSHVKIANAMFEITEAGSGYRKAERTTQELVEFCDKYKRQIQFTADCFSRHKVKHLSQAIVQATIAIASKFESEERLSEFVDVLFSGLPKSQEDFMAIKVRDFLMMGGATGGGTERRRASKAIMRGIYLFCRNQTLQKLVVPSESIYRL